MVKGAMCTYIPLWVAGVILYYSTLHWMYKSLSVIKTGLKLMETGEEFCESRGLHFTCSVICLLVRYDHGILQKFCTYGSTL